MALHDAAWKRLFSFTDLPRDLLAEFVPREWVEMLDLSTLEPWPGDLVSDGLRERHADRVWRVHRRDRRGFVLVTVEFQSQVDRTMAVRVLEYSTLLYQELVRNKELLRIAKAARAEAESKDRKGRKGRRRRIKPEPLPPVLPIVLYLGRKRWWARQDVAGVCAPSGEALAPYQPAQRYFVLDVGRYTDPLAEERNWMAELIRLARTPDPEVVAAELRDISARWPESEYDNLFEAVLAWLGQVHFPMHRIDLEVPELVNVREAITMLQQVGMDWSAKLRAEGRMEGRIEGRTEGQAAVICRQATWKFGLDTADRLAGYLAEITDPERLGEIGEWLLECDSGEALLDRVARLCETAAAEGGAAQG